MLDADGWASCGGCDREHYGLAGRSSLCHYCRPLRDGEPVPLDHFQHRVRVELGSAVLRQVGDARLGGEPVAAVVDVEVVRGVGQVAERVAAFGDALARLDAAELDLPVLQPLDWRPASGSCRAIIGPRREGVIAKSAVSRRRDRRRTVRRVVAG